MFLANKLNKGGILSSPDDKFNYVTMLLHGDGTNGAQNNTFLDSSTNNFTITRNGNTTQGSFSPYGSNWSNYFGGTGNYLTTATSASAFSFGTGDFTIEFWINSTQTTRCDPIGQNNTFSSSGWWGLIGNLSSSGQLQWFENTNSRISATATNWNNGSWNHIAVTRSGNSVRMFVNGTQVGSTYTTSFTYGASSVGVIAGVLSDDKTTGPLTGYMSNFRIVKGTALYTSSFTPSTTPLTAVSETSLLTCQANRFFDASTNALTITTTGTPSVQRFNPFGTSTAYSTSVIGGSGYFDGSGDYLQVANDSAFDFSGDFTVECWLYLANTNNQTFISKGGHNALGPDAAGWALFIYTGQGLRFMTRNSGGTNVPVTVASTPQINTWMHVAVSRSGSNMRSFLNGTLVSTVTSSVNTANSSPFNIGANLNNLSPSTGYICDVRIIKGTAQYTATFTPPTAPLTAITDTQFLENFTNGAIFDNAMMNDLETVGNAQISTSVKKYGTGSLAFDGTGDFLKGAFNPWVRLGTGDYTIELWVNFNSVSTSVFFGDINSSGNGNWAFFYNSSAGVLRLLMNDGGVTLSSSSWSPSTGIWYHIAISRASGTYRFFVNGTVTGSGSDSTNITWGTNNFYVGSASDGGLQLNGYIDDLRITKGYARYTANFTPPTSALSDTGPY